MVHCIYICWPEKIGVGENAVQMPPIYQIIIKESFSNDANPAFPQNEHECSNVRTCVRRTRHQSPNLPLQSNGKTWNPVFPLLGYQIFFVVVS